MDFEKQTLLNQGQQTYGAERAPIGQGAAIYNANGGVRPESTNHLSIQAHEARELVKVYPCKHSSTTTILITGAFFVIFLGIGIYGLTVVDWGYYSTGAEAGFIVGGVLLILFWPALGLSQLRSNPVKFVVDRQSGIISIHYFCFHPKKFRFPLSALCK